MFDIFEMGQILLSQMFPRALKRRKELKWSVGFSNETTKRFSRVSLWPTLAGCASPATQDVRVAQSASRGTGSCMDLIGRTVRIAGLESAAGAPRHLRHRAESGFAILNPVSRTPGTRQGLTNFCEGAPLNGALGEVMAKVSLPEIRSRLFLRRYLLPSSVEIQNPIMYSRNLSKIFVIFAD